MTLVSGIYRCDAGIRDAKDVPNESSPLLPTGEGNNSDAALVKTDSNDLSIPRNQIIQTILVVSRIWTSRFALSCTYHKCINVNHRTRMSAV